LSLLKRAGRFSIVKWEKKRDGSGRWPLENPHAGLVHFDMEDGAGKPSRWNTPRALRVYWTGIQHEPSANTPGRRPGLTVMIPTRIALV
jgi:hypothetical protein